MSTLALLKQMMKFRPVTAEVGQVNRLADFVADYLRAHGRYVRMERSGGRRILYAAARPTKAPALLFNAHLDVVPAASSDFSPRRRGAWLYGRGSSDCLSNCAVIAKVLAHAPQGADVGAVFSTDEETGGLTTLHMVARGYRGGLIVIMDGEGYRLTVAQKGILNLRLRAHGRAGHSSAPWLGRNAIDRLIDGYLKIRACFPDVRRGDEWHDTAAATLVNGGTVFNRIPDTAEMVLNIRHVEQTDPAALVRRLRRLSGLEIERMAGLDSPLVFCDENHPMLAGLRDFMRRGLRRPIAVTRMNGATDARHFARLGVPMAMIGVPGRNAHAADECVHIDGMEKYARLLARLVAEGFGGKTRPDWFVHNGNKARSQVTSAGEK